jgi:membrane-bound ClpP family serine protease
MHSSAWSWRILLKYFLLQFPALALAVVVLVFIQRWIALPPWLFWGIIAAWIAKDAALFPFVWRSYAPAPPTPVNTPIGEVGVTRERLAPTGYIRVRGTLWRAELAGGGPPLESGKTVRIQERRGLTLIVVPEEEASGG